MIAVDTNILVYAHRADSPSHVRALQVLTDLATGPAPFAIPWPCVSEFLAVVTHPRIYRPTSTIAEALGAIRGLEELPHIRFLTETHGHIQLLNELCTPAIAGAKLHDARIAAICVGHGISELLTADRDFSYFPQLNTRNPLVN